MSKKKDPAFLFYPQDFLTGTIFMTNEQIGIYVKLLCIQHQHGGLIDKKAFDDIVKNDKAIRCKFVATEDGYYNERLMDEIIKRNKKSANLSDNAKKRWENAKQKQCKSNAIASDLHMPIEDENENEDETILKERFELFWNKYPRKTNKKKSNQIFSKLNPTDELLDKMLHSLDSYLASGQWDDKQFIPHPTTWLNNEKWNDEIFEVKTKDSVVYSDYDAIEFCKKNNIAVMTDKGKISGMSPAFNEMFEGIGENKWKRK